MDASAFFDTVPLDDNVADLLGDFGHLNSDLFGDGDFMMPDLESFSPGISQQNPTPEQDHAPVENTPARTSAAANLADEGRRTSLPSPDPSSNNSSPHGSGFKVNTQGQCITASPGVKQFTAIALSSNIAKQATVTAHSPERPREHSHIPQKKFADLEAQIVLLENENRALVQKVKELESITTQIVRSFNAYKVEQVQFIQNSIPEQVQHFLQLHLQNMQQAFAELKKPPLVPHESPHRTLLSQGNVTSRMQASPISVGPPQVPKQSPKRRRTNDGSPPFASTLLTPQHRNNIGTRPTPINPPSAQHQSGYSLVQSQIADTNISATNSVSGDPLDRLIKASIDLNARTKRAYAEYGNKPPADVVNMFEKERRDMWHSLPPEQQKRLQQRVIEFQTLNCTPPNQFSSGSPPARMTPQNKMLQPSSAPIAPMTHQPGILLPEGNEAPFATAGGVFVQTPSHDLGAFPEGHSQLPGGAQSFLSPTPAFNPPLSMLPISMMPTGQNAQFYRMMQDPAFPQMPLYSQLSPHQQNTGNLQTYEQQLNVEQQMSSMFPYQQNGLPLQMTPPRPPAIVPSTPTSAIIGQVTPSQPRKSASNKKRKGASENNSSNN